MDQLAQRYHIDPERLERLGTDTISRGLQFMDLEGQATAKKG